MKYLKLFILLLLIGCATTQKQDPKEVKPHFISNPNLFSDDVILGVYYPKKKDKSK